MSSGPIRERIKIEVARQLCSINVNVADMPEHGKGHVGIFDSKRQSTSSFIALGWLLNL